VTSETKKSNDLHGIPKYLWQIDNPFAWSDSASIHVDLGAGRFPRNPFGATTLLATDFHAGFKTPVGVEFVKADLTKKLPFEDDSIWSFSAFDVLEHIPRWERIDGEIVFPFIHLMSEIHRCLKPGGVFMAITPAFPSSAAFQDPTHVNIISKETILYFSGAHPWGADLGYGFVGNFNVVVSEWLKGSGPFSEKKMRDEIGAARGTAKVNLKARLARRFLLTFINRTPSHLSWVLEKKDQRNV
jgi:SAM-dependent methyltransferase